jgi:YVTN family beta-propeller protein
MRAPALFVACIVLAAATPIRGEAKPLLAVSAEAGGEVVLVDPATTQVVGRIKVGVRPRGLKASKDGRRLVVALAGPPRAAAKPGAPAAPVTAGVAVVDVATRKVAKQIAISPAPFGVDLLPDGKTAFVSNSDTNEIFAIDLVAGSVKKKLGVGAGPQAVAVRPDGKVVYVATHGSDEVSAIDPKTVTLLGRIDAGPHPQTVLFAPRGDTAVATDEGAPVVTIVDAKKNTFKEQFVLQGLPKTTPPPAMQSAVFSPDGKRLYVTMGGGKSVLIVDPAKKAAVGTIDGVGTFPRGIAISPDGKKLYTANGASNDVAIIDIASKKVEARVAVPGAPWGIVFLK